MRWTTALLCLLVLVPATYAAKPDFRPNVLLICVDDLKPVLGCYGDAVAKTPNIDLLAARGVLFQHAYCNQAVCSPSRNALLTGLRPQTLGIYDLATNFRQAAPAAVTLPQHFRAHGYSAEALGKIFHVGHGNADDVASWDAPLFRPRAKTYARSESEPSAEQRAGSAKLPAHKRARGAATEAAAVPDEAYADGQVATEAIRRLEEKAKGEGNQPWFMAVGFIRPHLPFVAPQKYWDLYDPAQLPMPALDAPPTGAPEYAPTNSGELRQYQGMPARGPLSIEQTRHLIHGYYAAVSYMDAQVGRLLATLDDAKLAEKTIVVLWGDHGWHLGDHGQWCKHTNYEQATRIPLIVAAPGASAGGRSDALVETVDIYPTLAEVAGLPNPKQIDGRSFAGVVRQPTAPAREWVSHVYPRGEYLGRAARTERYRIVEWKRWAGGNREPDLELYDYQADPAETKNVAHEQPEVVARLQALLMQQPAPKAQVQGSAPASSNERAKPKQDRDTMFTRRDRDQDGYLSREEFLFKQPDPEEAPARFPKFDADGDGRLSREEFVRGGRKPR